MSETEIQGHTFDGDPDGINFIQLLDRHEMETLIYSVDNKGEANLLDSKNNLHWEITKSSDNIYMISKVKPHSSSWF